MTAFVWETAFEVTIGFEGGYVYNPHDKGGETKYGISKKSYPFLDIKNLTKEQAKEIYKRDYWDRCKCDFIPDALAIALFDFAVNSGVNRAVRYLQRSVGVTVDGVIGNQTIGACNRVITRIALEKFIEYRMKYLLSLKDWKYFGNGWGARVKLVKGVCEKYL